MSIVLFEMSLKDLHGQVHQNKFERVYTARITLHGMTIYHNFFPTKEKAIQAVRRNIKKYV